MWTWLKRFAVAFLLDEAAAQRYLAALCFLVGSWLESGGVVPGTDVVVPVGHAFKYGPLIKALGFYLGAGSMLPGRRNGSNGSPRPPGP